MSDSTFTLYKREITTIMEGDREEDHGWDRDPMELGDFATLREAEAKAREYAAKDSVETHPTRYGIGSMTRPVYEIETWNDDESETVYQLDVMELHPEYRKAWDKAKADYYKWLDYEDCDEGYGTLADYLED